MLKRLNETKREAWQVKCKEAREPVSVGGVSSKCLRT